MKFKALLAATEISKVPNNNPDAHPQTHLLQDADKQNVATNNVADPENQIVRPIVLHCNQI